MQVHARVTFLVSDLMQDQDPSVKGLALHRMRHDASVSWPRAGICPPLCKDAPLQMLMGACIVAMLQERLHNEPYHPCEARITSACDTVDTAPSAEWKALSSHLLPAVRACLLRQHPDAALGWHDAVDACLKAEAICEALSLYHLLLSRDGIRQQGSATGLPHICFSAVQ